AALFESEPAVGSRSFAVFDSERSYGQSVTFRRGPVFVRLVAYQDTPATEQALVGRARTIEAGAAR
ncbi:MAG TPA: hypothetical protein VGS58_14240, partial [Candidatus Sulfopaludibacter sp.]|nr:hypothetical protein [Candidatus Sulfopaludibacter sp.]